MTSEGEQRGETGKGEAGPGEAGPGEAGFDAATWIGRTIDERYRIEQLLGQGGMGAVFLAEHVKLQKKVALKVILPQFAGNGEVAERFAREAMTSAKLEHPHVASALDYGALADGGAYLVMQLARGPSLRSWLEQNGSGWRHACEIGRQIADALSAAHAEGIVHRDLKPENVMLEPRDDGTHLVKVLDFGIARLLGNPSNTDQSASQLTRVGTIIGTPGYMPPEQGLGEAVDARADLYALGVILWEICAGRELWDEPDFMALVTRQLSADAERVARVATDVPPELDELIARLLARDKNARPERAGEVRDTLSRLLLVSTVERMSAANAAASSVDATGSTIFARASGDNRSRHGVTPNPSVITAQRLSEQAIDVGRQIAPRLLAPPMLYIALGGVGFVGLVMFSLLVMVCAGAPEPTPIATVPVVPVPVAPVPAPVVPSPPPRGVEPPGTTLEAAPWIADLETLSGDSNRRRRRDAAERILALPRRSMPDLVWSLAELETESRCEDRRPIVVTLGALGDARARPTLERMQRNRRGCGFFGRQDCNGCLRDELRVALDQLPAR